MVGNSLYSTYDLKRSLGISEAFRNGALMARVADRNHTDIGYTRPQISPGQSALKLRTVIDARHEDYLGIELDPCVEQALKRLNAPRSMTADQSCADVSGHSVKGYTERRNALLDDAIDILIGQVRQRDEIALQKTQAIIVIFDRKARTCMFGKLTHEAEATGIATRANLVENSTIEGNAPALPFFALKFNGSGIPVSIYIS